MGTISLIPPVAGTEAEAGTIATAFSTIQGVINGNLDGANLSPAAQLAIAKLTLSNSLVFPDATVQTTAAGASSFKTCLVRASGTQTLTHQVNNVIAFDTEISDAYGMHAPGDNTKITVPDTGIYNVTAYVPNSQVFSPQLWKNGSMIEIGYGNRFSTTVSLSSSDYLQIIVYNDAASTDYSTSLVGEGPKFTVTKFA